MSEETLNRLFEQAKNEAPETKLSDIQKWIGLGTLAVLLTGILAKMKLIITLKPFIMISSALVAVGIGTGVFLIANTSDQPKATSHITREIKTPNKNIVPVSAKEEEKEKSPITVARLSPIAPVSTIWEDQEPYPSLEYCGSLPVVAPIPPMRVYQPYKVFDEVTDYGTFNALKISGAADVVVIKGTKSGVRLEGDEKGKESAVIKNNNQTLEIYTDCKGNKWNNDCNFKLTIYVTVEDLKKITCTGASTLKSDGELKLDDLDMIVSGASEIKLELAVSNLKIDASGASEIILDGKAEEMKLMNSGATEFRADGLEVQTAKVDCSGASEVSINVASHLDIKVSGASDFEYTGAAVIGNKSVTGASDFRHK